jgi:hypothetical protein
MQVEREPGSLLPGDSGERVRNTWATCPSLWDNPGKPELIPDTPTGSHGPAGKGPPERDGPAAYQLVGEVTAHQGVDG